MAENNDKTNNSTPVKLNSDDEESLFNFIGCLNEKCQKSGWTHKYEYKRSGEDHCPVFTTLCILNMNGETITGKGEGKNKRKAKENSARDVIKQLNKREETLKSVPNGQNCAKEEDFNNYFKRIKELSQDLKVIIADSSSDTHKKLTQMTELLGCYLEWIPSEDVTNWVVLKVMIKELDSPLFLTFGESNDRPEVCKRIAENKAFRLFETLLSEDEN